MSLDLVTAFAGSFLALSMVKLSEIIWKRYFDAKVHSWFDKREAQIKKVREKVKVVGTGFGGNSYEEDKD